MKQINRIRFIVYALGIFAIIATTKSFWPPDIIPHPHLPDPRDNDPHRPVSYTIFMIDGRCPENYLV